MGGGFPAAAFGGRADVMAHLAPEGPVYQAGTLSGTRSRPPPGSTTLRLATDAVYAQVDARRADRVRRPPARRCAPPGVPHVVQAGGSMFSVFFTDRDRGHRLRRRRGARTPPRTPRSSTPCSTRASTCRPAPSRRGSCPPPTTTARSTAIVAGAARGRPRRRRGRPSRGVRDRHERTTVVHLLRHGEVHNPDGVLYGRPPGYHLSELGRAMAERVAESSADRDITHLVASPLERAQETARPAGATPGPDDRHRRPRHRVEQHVRGQDVRRRRRRARATRPTGGTCGTRSGRPGASRTSTSPSG